MRTRRLPLPVRAAVWAVFAVLAGLLAMHGLGTHGTTAGSSGSHGEHAGHAMTADPTLVHDDVPVLAPAQPPASADHVLASCLVVLGLALLLLVGLAAPGTSASAARLPVASRTLPARARAPDPPDLVRMSICRC